MWKDRILSAVMAVIVTAAISAAIVRFSPEKPQFTPSQLEGGITLETTGVAPGETVVSVDGNGASAELLTYQIGENCAYIDSMLRAYTGEGLDLGAALPDGTIAREYVREEALAMLKQQLVLENLCARYGVALPAEDEAEIAAQRAAYIEQYGGEEGYRAELYKLGFGDEAFQRLLRAGYLYQALYAAYTTPGSELYATDDVLRAYAAGAGWITADHILLMTIDQQTREPLPAATVAEKRALAEDLLWRLRDSAEPVALFDELADEYGEDPGRQANPQGYTFTRGTMVEAFDSAARALAENEYSDLVESEYGFHIILRRPLDVAKAVEAVRPEYFEAFFLGELERAELECSPLVERFDVDAIYAALLDAQGAADETPPAAAP